VESLNKIECRRVRQKPAKVNLKEPLRKYLIRPILSWVPDKLKAAIEGALPRRTKTNTKGSDLKEANAAVKEPADYPFTLSDFEFRNDSLHEALDLKAIALRIK